MVFFPTLFRAMEIIRLSSAARRYLGVAPESGLVGRLPFFTELLFFLLREPFSFLYV